MPLPVESVKNKKNIKRAIYVFIAVMLFLSFFSKTINNLMLPRTKTVSPHAGLLTKELRAEGTIEARKVYKTYVRDSFKVEEMLVQPGETVYKGQVLMILDKKDLERRLQDELNTLDQKKISFARVLLDKSRREGEIERQIEAARDELEQKQKSASRIRTLYENGAETKVNLERAEAELRAAERAYDAALNGGDKPAAEYDLDVQNARLDIEMQKNKVDALQEEMEIAGNVAAPDNGVIAGLNCSKGSLTDPSKPLYALACVDWGFELKVTVDGSKADYFALGDEADVRVDSAQATGIKGKIRGIGNSPANEAGGSVGGKKDIYIDIASTSLAGGEHAEIHIKKETRTFAMLLPNEAVHKENENAYVYVLKEKDGALGREYYINKVKIFCEDSDDSHTAVSGGLILADKVVLSSDRTFSVGDRVKPVNDIGGQ
ncbi:MAG: hypothetical protein ABFD04_07090 [Syntrophomonas sp.]